MKITRQQLRRLINESINEHIIKPDASTSGIPPKYLDKIHNLIDSGDPEKFNMAISLIDGLGGDTSYAYSYRDYPRVGDLEKLGNKASDILHDISSGRGTPEMYDDVYGPGGTNDQADAIVSDYVDKLDSEEWFDAFATHNERYTSSKNRHRPREPHRFFKLPRR